MWKKVLLLVALLAVPTLALRLPFRFTRPTVAKMKATPHPGLKCELEYNAITQEAEEICYAGPVLAEQADVADSCVLVGEQGVRQIWACKERPLGNAANCGTLDVSNSSVMPKYLSTRTVIYILTNSIPTSAVPILSVVVCARRGRMDQRRARVGLLHSLISF